MTLKLSRTIKLFILLFSISLSLLLQILFSTSVKAQTKQLIEDQDFSVDAAAAIDSLYNRNNEAAHKLLNPWKENHPDHPLWTLWEGMEMWWVLLEDLEIDEYDELFIEKMKEADFRARRLLQKEPGHLDALIVISVSNSYIARLHSNRERWITSLQVGRSGYQAHLSLMEVKPDLADNYFAEGMKLYYSAYVQEEYPIVRPVAYFLPDGDREAGIQLLREATEKALFSRPEAAYFLATIQLYYEENFTEARNLFRYLVDQYPNNSYYRRLYMNTLWQLREYSSMIGFHEETSLHWKENNLARDAVMEYELYYWAGRAFYIHLNYDSAYQLFVNAVESAKDLPNRENRNYYAPAAYFAGRASEDMGKTVQAVYYYKLATSQNSPQEVIERAKERLTGIED